ncbi:MAG: DUF1844 domain-containing protein [Chthoniobacteraceae bacterium]|jgi:hypothetical protein
MAEIQESPETSGEMAQRFIELVMMQAQNAAYALGQIPHPETNEAPVNLELARLFIDQLIVLRAKTRNNLSNEELAILNNTISNLQMVFFEISQGAKTSTGNGEASEPAEPPAAGQPAPTPEPAAPSSEEESRKKFTKSYGA